MSPLITMYEAVRGSLGYMALFCMGLAVYSVIRNLGSKEDKTK